MTSRPRRARLRLDVPGAPRATVAVFMITSEMSPRYLVGQASRHGRRRRCPIPAALCNDAVSG
jgi:hypothetical protein